MEIGEEYEKYCKKAVFSVAVIFAVCAFSPGGGITVHAQTNLEQAHQKVEERSTDVENVYNELFSGENAKKDPTFINVEDSVNKVGLTKLANGKIAFVSDGKMFYPRGIEMGWWDVRVDDNGTMLPNGGTTGQGEYFKEISDDEWRGHFSDAKNIGFNTVQILVYWSDWQPDSPFGKNGEVVKQGDERYNWKFMDNVVSLAAEQNLKVEWVLFFHSQTDNIPTFMDNFWAYQFDTVGEGRDKYSLSMQWGATQGLNSNANGKCTSSEDNRAKRSSGAGWGHENFLEYWHPDLFPQLKDAITALGTHFKDNPNVIGYQIGNEEGFNPYCNGGNDNNPYFQKMFELYKKNGGNDNKLEFKRDLVNKVWASMNNALRLGDPYRPTTTNIQSSAMEESGAGLPGKKIAENDGTSMSFYNSVDMAGPMTYGNSENKWNNLSQAFNIEGQGFAKGFPLLFPSEIGAYHANSAVAIQTSAMTIARGGVGMGFYCYGELYNDIEKNGISSPKPGRADQAKLQRTLQGVEKLLWEGMPVNQLQTNDLFLEYISGAQGGKPIIGVLESVDHSKILGVMHYPGYSGTRNDKEDRTLKAKLSTKHSTGTYKLTMYETSGKVTAQIVNVTKAEEPIEFTFNSRGSEATYITVEKTGESELPEGVLTGIELISAPIKKTYNVGEELNTSGIQVRANYSNGTAKMIDTNSLTFEGFDSSAPSDRMEVMVKYAEAELEFTASFTVSVERGKYYVSGLESFYPNSLDLWFDGVIAEDESGAFKATNELKEKMADGEAYVEYNFDDYVELTSVDLWTNYGADQGIATFKVAVQNDNGEWEFISETGNDENGLFTADWTTKESAAQELQFSFGEQKKITQSVRLYIMSVNDSWSENSTGINKFTMREVEFNNTPLTLNRIEVTALPTQIEYVIFENLKPEGLVVTAYYEGGIEKILNSTDVNVKFDNFLTPGEKVITVSYKGQNTTFNVNVREEWITMKLTPPTKLVYEMGETFDRTGLEVIVTSRYGTEQNVTDEVEISGFETDSAGEKTVTVTYTKKHQTTVDTVNSTFTIVVNESNPDPNPSPEPDPNPNPEPNSSFNKGTSNNTSTIQNAVKTGDNTAILQLAVVMIIAFGTVTGLIVYNKKRKS